MTTSSQTLMVKSYHDPIRTHAEADGLNHLAKVSPIKTPNIIHLDDHRLIMEFIDNDRRQAQWRELGSGLARMHNHTLSKQHGWHCDNFLGRSKQINTPCETWSDFFVSKRIEIHLHNLEKSTPQFGKSLNSLWDKKKSTAEKELDTVKAYSLIHGDLWSGNVIFGPEGEPYLIDPAVYRGDREADLAMVYLFGKFPDSFFDEYFITCPKSKNFQRKQKIYQLYHLLNHAVLFGDSYFSSCREILENL
ncbi:MAG: fructosamine kinase family protein [Bdellovibrionota bacterium]